MDSFQSVRVFYPHADGVTAGDGRTLTVFNVCGNRYRLVVQIVYAVRTIYVVGIMTHVEYDRGRWGR